MSIKELIQALIDQGLSYYKIAQETGISRHTLNNWHNEKTKPSNRLIEKPLWDFAQKFFDSRLKR